MKTNWIPPVIVLGISLLAERANGNDAEAEIARLVLEQARRPQSRHTLVQVAQDANYSAAVRLAAVRALGSSRRTGRVTQALEHLASNADEPEIRHAAASFLEERAQ